MPIKTKGRIAIAAVIQQKATSQIDFLNSTFNLCEITLQRSHPHHNCNLAKVLIAQSTAIPKQSVLRTMLWSVLRFRVRVYVRVRVRVRLSQTTDQTV